MKVLDIFSWLPEKQISLGHLEQIFRDYVLGIHNDKYSVQFGTPNNASDNILISIGELAEEGKKVACILEDDNIIAVIGYKE